MSSDATAYLQLHQLIEDVLLHLLWDFYVKLEPPSGSLAGVYPKAIVNTIGAWAAQSVIHRGTTAECLNHYQRPLLGSCTYRLPTMTVDDYLTAIAKLNLVQIGAVIDISAKLAQQDPFIVPVLLTQVGAKSRVGAVVNMMQNHMAAAAPREVAIPAQLAWSFVTRGFVDSCPDKIAGMPEKPWPVVEVTGKKDDGGKTVAVNLKYEGSGPGTHFVAWMGPYGQLEFTPVTTEGDGRTAAVPASWYGYVWIAVVSKNGIKLDELKDNMVAGPEMVWVREP
jgi:hypothetical protein